MGRERQAISVMLVLVATTGAGADPVIRVDVTEQFKPEKLVGKRLVVRGRVSLSTRSQLRLYGCRIVFRPTGDILPASKAVVELEGRLIKHDGRYECRLMQPPRILPPFREQLRQRRRDVDADDHQQWYRLGDWARRHGAFYSDETLRLAGVECYRKAIRAERRALRPPRFAALLKLAEKARRLISDEERALVVHAAMLAAEEAARSGTTAEEFKLANALPGHLAGADQPLSEADLKQHASLWLAYDSSPEEAYRGAKPAERRKLARWLFRRVLTAAFRRAAAGPPVPAPKALVALAEKAEERLPDAPLVAKDIWRRWAKEELRHVATLADARVERLARVYRDKLGEGDQADVLVRGLLDRRRRGLPRGDAEGRVELARQYLDRTGDSETAIDLLKEADRLDPKLADAGRLLRELGFEHDGTKWVRSARLHGSRRGRILEAIRQGRVIAGMTPDEVRQSQGGKPDRKSRSLTKAGLAVQWVYEGRPPLLVTILNNNVISVHPPARPGRR